MATPILSLKNVSLSIGTKTLFDGIDLHLEARNRVCLVGRNGMGKSTLLKVIAGIVESDSGERSVKPGLQISYLPQDPFFEEEITVKEYIAKGLKNSDENYRVDMFVADFCLNPDGLLPTLSGGEARRTALARAFIMEPDLVLLDEPTNHLDLPTILWLEDYLKNFKGAFITISHDRAFLKHLTNETLWLDRGKLHFNPQGYATFAEWSTKMLEDEAQEQHRLSKKFDVEMKWLREGLTARRRRNQGRVRALNKLREERRNYIRADRNTKLEISQKESGGKIVIDAENISKSYGDKCVVNGFSPRILWGDRIGIIGPNGAGKTTLLKILLDQLEPDGGTVRHGTRLEPIYFDQKRFALNPEDTLWQALCGAGGDTVYINDRPKHVVGYLKDFLFLEEQAHAMVKTLSGGERNRLLLAKLFTKSSNFMILDEPTNDLDIETLELLEDELSSYPGTLLIVSHDRDFLDHLVTHLYVFEGDGNIIEYPGSYSEYLETQSKAQLSTQQAVKKQPKEKKTKAKTKLSYNEARELEQLPLKIDDINNSIEKLEKILENPEEISKNIDEINSIAAKLTTLRKQLEDAEHKWLELLELQENLEG
jgi:ABC transport system ATP-binding/permease protein